MAISIGEAGAFMIDLSKHTLTTTLTLFSMTCTRCLRTFHKSLPTWKRGSANRISGASALADEELIAQMDAKLSKVFPDDRQLYLFQYVGVRFAELAGGRCLIGDDMGVGKTIQAIAHIALNTDKLPALIVAPASSSTTEEGVSSMDA